MNAETPADLLGAITALPGGWHGAGSLSGRVLGRLGARLAGRDVAHSLETGVGRSTLLFSHLSRQHTVFTKDDAGDGDSLSKVSASSLLHATSTTFVIGPTQMTLRQHSLEPLDAVLLDGPHAYPFPELEYYAIYPHLNPGALLVLDDIHIPTVAHLYRFLRYDDMFTLDETVENTAFFTRTTAPTFNPVGDSWPDQALNRAQFPVRHSAADWARWAIPAPLRRQIHRARNGRLAR